MKKIAIMTVALFVLTSSAAFATTYTQGTATLGGNKLTLPLRFNFPMGSAWLIQRIQPLDLATLLRPPIRVGLGLTVPLRAMQKFSR